MFAYCGNNPINYIDSSGEFPWLIAGIIICAGFIGGVAGYYSDEKLGADPSKNIPNTSGTLKHPSEITEEDLIPPEPVQKEPLTTEDRVYNAFLGATLGMAAGGLLVSGMGAVATVAAGSGAAFIPAFGATAAQTFAYGALVYDIIGMIFSVLLGVESEPIEVE